MQRKRHAIAEPDALESDAPGRDWWHRRLACSRLAPRLTVLVRTLDQLDAVLAWSPPDGLPRPAAVYCDFEDLRRYKDAVPRAQRRRHARRPRALRILKPGEDGFQSLDRRARTRTSSSSAISRRSATSANTCRTRRSIGDFSLNVANELTADLLIRAGPRTPRAELRPELGAARVDGPPLDARLVRAGHSSAHADVSHGALRLRGVPQSTGKDHRDCGRPCDRHKVELRDRVGANFPVLPDTGCRNTVFNTVPQSGAEYVGRMRELGLARFRVDLLRETPAQVGPLLNRYARVVGGLDDGRTAWRELRALNQLGVTRGSLQML